jgi:hypothetical protein
MGLETTDPYPAGILVLGDPGPTSTGDGIVYNALRTILSEFGISANLCPFRNILRSAMGFRER